MIHFKCGKCGKKLAAKDESAGKRVKCPACGQIVPVPAATAAPAGGAAGGAAPPPAPSPKPSEPAAAKPRRPRAEALPAADPVQGSPVPQATGPSGAPGPGEPPKPGFGAWFKTKNRKAADILGASAIVLGVIACAGTLLVQLVGGICCGWIGWPLVILPIPCAVLAILKGDLRRHKIMAIVAIVLSVIGIILAILILIGVGAAASGVLQQMQEGASSGR